MNEILLQSFSKVNIGLKVVKKRKDGYHDIHTVFQELDFHDQISLKKSTDGCFFTSNVNWLENNNSNLCVRAWELLAEKYNISGVRINLNKNIPPGSGLGGGSSNAACVLKGLIKLYNLNIRHKDLIKISSLIGADVPFFIRGGCQLGSLSLIHI